MKSKYAATFIKYRAHGQAHRWWLLGVAGLMAVGGLILIVLSYKLVSPYRQYVIQPSLLADGQTMYGDVGIVLGAGVSRQGKPYKELQARLDAGADALQNGYVRKLILSGDNRFKNYNEPNAMKQYLVDVRHIDPSKLQPDYAGRSTYESCDRAARVFGLHQAIIFSADSHLPRAIYLCRHLGVEAYGVSSGLEANNATRRELLARVKAVYNIYIRGERTVLGAPIAVE